MALKPIKPNNFFLLSCFLIIIGAGLFLYFQDRQGQNRVCFERLCFNVELARTQDEQLRGLMEREKIEENEGMLFIFEKEDFYPIWMKNMRFPLDIIWLDQSGEVVYLQKNALPCVTDDCEIFWPIQKASYVLEVNAGVIDMTDVEVGERATFWLGDK